MNRKQGEQSKNYKTEAFRNTEKLLTYYQELKEHLENEEEYIEMLNRQSAKSIVRYSKNQEGRNEDLRLMERKESYERSCADVKRIENALRVLKDRKGYEVIEKRFFEKKKNGERRTYEEIAEELAGNGRYSENLNEKTVRSYKNKMITDMSIILFGTDAL